jgi:hypothetical protein
MVKRKRRANSRLQREMSLALPRETLKHTGRVRGSGKE